MYGASTLAGFVKEDFCNRATGRRVKSAVMKSLRFLCMVLLPMSLRAAPESPASALADALRKEDLPAVRASVAAGRLALGDKAGIPEVADKYAPLPKDGSWLTATDAQRGFAPHFSELEKLCWWRVGIDPVTIKLPLRGPASVLAGTVAACRAKLDGEEKSLAVARDAAEFLIWAQEQAGNGVFPFPASRGASGDRAMSVGAAFLQRAEKEGKLDQIVRNGWVVDDLGDGGLQFDNGECGVAMFEYYELTRDAKALASARKAADWAAARPLATNWNYNSFSVYLLAKAFAVTGERSYFESAKKKALIGVIPGQLADGPRAGRWLDPHNARPAYHYIMLRALAQLAAVLPADDASRPDVMRALTLGLKTRNAEILSDGAMNKDKVIEVLLLVNVSFAKDADFLRASLSADALDAMGKGISAEARRGKSPLAPREWGHFLQYIAARARP